MCSCISECFYRLIWAWISGKAADRVWLIAKGLGVGLIVVIVMVDVGLVLLPIGAIPTDNAGPLLSGGTGQSALTLDVKHYQAGAPVYDAADSDFEDAVAGAEPARDRVAPTTAIGARQRLPDLQGDGPLVQLILSLQGAAPSCLGDLVQSDSGT